MNDGHSAQWIESLEVLETRLTESDRIYTGHGEPGIPGKLIAAQRDYLRHYRQHVSRLVDSNFLMSNSAKEMLVQEMNVYLGVDRLSVFVSAGAQPIADELAAEAS